MGPAPCLCAQARVSCSQSDPPIRQCIAFYIGLFVHTNNNKIKKKELSSSWPPPPPLPPPADIYSQEGRQVECAEYRTTPANKAYHHIHHYRCMRLLTTAFSGFIRFSHFLLCLYHSKRIGLLYFMTLKNLD